MTQAPISEYRLNNDTDIGYHPTPISVAAVPDIGHRDVGPDIDTDIVYAVYDIGDRMPRYRGVSDIGVNIGPDIGSHPT